MASVDREETLRKHLERIGLENLLDLKKIKFINWFKILLKFYRFFRSEKLHEILAHLKFVPDRTKENEVLYSKDLLVEILVREFHTLSLKYDVLYNT